MSTIEAYLNAPARPNFSKERQKYFRECSLVFLHEKPDASSAKHFEISPGVYRLSAHENLYNDEKPTITHSFEISREHIRGWLAERTQR